MEGTAVYASDAESGDNYGASVSIHQDRAIVGAFSESANPFVIVGAAYIYEWDGTGWSEAQKIMSSFQGKHSFFGDNVAIYGDRAMVTARNEDDFVGPTFHGLVYAFEWDGTSWVETDILEFTADNISEYQGEIKALMCHFMVTVL